MPRGIPGIARGPARARAVTLVEVLVVTALISLLAALLIPAVAPARESARRIRCLDNLRQVGLANQSYSGLHNSFPSLIGSSNRPGFQKQFSPFSRILGFAEQGPLFDAINFQVGLVDLSIFPDPAAQGRPLGWEANSTAMGVSLGFLLCPSDGAPTVSGGSAGTNYRANAGVDPILTNDGRTGGPFPMMGALSVAMIVDGMSHTAAFAEKLRGEVGRGPLDPRVDLLVGVNLEPYDLRRTLEDCAYQPAAPGHYYTAVGTNWLVGSLSQACYNHFGIPDGPEPDCLAKGFNPVAARASARSNHASGVNVGLADGSVRLVRRTIASGAWRALGTRSGGEIDDSL